MNILNYGNFLNKIFEENKMDDINSILSSMDKKINELSYNYIKNKKMLSDIVVGSVCKYNKGGIIDGSFEKVMITNINKRNKTITFTNIMESGGRIMRKFDEKFYLGKIATNLYVYLIDEENKEKIIKNKSIINNILNTIDYFEEFVNKNKIDNVTQEDVERVKNYYKNILDSDKSDESGEGWVITTTNYNN